MGCDVVFEWGVVSVSTQTHSQITFLTDTVRSAVSPRDREPTRTRHLYARSSRIYTAVVIASVTARSRRILKLDLQSDTGRLTWPRTLRPAQRYPAAIPSGQLRDPACGGSRRRKRAARSRTKTHRRLGAMQFGLQVLCYRVSTEVHLVLLEDPAAWSARYSAARSCSPAASAVVASSSNWAGVYAGLAGLPGTESGAHDVGRPFNAT